MNDPFILTAYDAGEFEIAGEKITGLIMDYVESGNLRSEINDSGKVSFGRAIMFAGEIVHALESMRRLNIVHRDLKPDNIFIQKLSDGTEIARVGDFGISALTEDARIELFRTAPEEADLKWAEVITDPGNIVGTLQYTAPEMFKLRHFPDHRTDLYALGITMYEMIASRRPFFGENIRDYVLAHQMDPPPSFSEIKVNDVPKWLEEIVMKLLEKDPNNRFQTAKEVYDAIRKGVEKDYPKLLTQIPFVWDVSL
jgi:serine/threonine-protein kinase